MAAWRAPGDGGERSAIAGPRPYVVELAAHPGRLVAATAITVAAVTLLWWGQRSAHADSGLGPPQPVVSVPVADVTGSDTLFRAAAASCPGLDWSLLAGIYTVETSAGRNAVTSPAGALGPMQFLPSTWSEFQVDGNRDGRADAASLPDAAFGAARMLCADGAARPDRVAPALWDYNHSDDYVARVEAAAASVRQAATRAVSGR